MKISRIGSGFFLAVSIGVSLVATPAVAAEIVWNTTISRLGHPQSIGTWGLANVQLQVKYRTSLTNMSTGAPIICGSAVPVSTKVKYRFEQGAFDDVYWVGSGYNADSPYGAWVDDAARPAGNMCIEQNKVHGVLKHISPSYGILSISPPLKTLRDAPPGCAKDTDGQSYTCTLDTPGSYNPAYVFGATVGKFYGTGGLLGSAWEQADPNCKPQELVDPEGYTYTQHCFTVSDKMSGPLHCSDAPLLTPQVNIPEQTHPCAITVVAVSGGAPDQPSITSSKANNACIVGTAYTISMEASDPDGHQIRYGIDWDANGTVDQYVPASGYVPSGTAQTASRTFSAPGEKNIRVLAQDETGMMSSWAHMKASCSEVIIQNSAQEIESDIENGDASGAGIGYGLGIGSGSGAPSADLSLRAVPSLIRRGATTKVTWSAVNVASCTVTASNGDTWTGLASPIGGRVSRPITGQTTYTLTCLVEGAPLTKTAVVNVLPSWAEQ